MQESTPETRRRGPRRRKPEASDEQSQYFKGSDLNGASVIMLDKQVPELEALTLALTGATIYRVSQVRVKLRTENGEVKVVTR